MQRTRMDLSTNLYSIAIEKGTVPQTLIAAVTDNESATVPNNRVPHPSENNSKSEIEFAKKNKQV